MNPVHVVRETRHLATWQPGILQDPQTRTMCPTLCISFFQAGRSTVGLKSRNKQAAGEQSLNKKPPAPNPLVWARRQVPSNIHPIVLHGKRPARQISCNATYDELAPVAGYCLFVGSGTSLFCFMYKVNCWGL